MSLETSKTPRIKYQLVGDTVSLACFTEKIFIFIPFLPHLKCNV